MDIQKPQFEVPHEWNVVSKQYRLLAPLGKGSFGIVYKAQHLITLEIVAIKMVSNFNDCSYRTRQLLRELILLRKLTEIKENAYTSQLKDIILPHSIQIEIKQSNKNFNLHCSEETQMYEQNSNNYSLNYDNLNHIFIVMEYIESDFRKLLEQPVQTNLEDDHIVIMIYNSLCALNFLHSANVIHRDIKPGNMLLNSQCNVKLCDFGLARSITNKNDNDRVIEKFQKKIYSFEQEAQYKQIDRQSRLQQFQQQNSMYQTNCDQDQQNQIEAEIIIKQDEEEKDSEGIKLKFLQGQLTEYLNQTMDERENRQRYQTCETQTRWYRSPEVILTHKGYNKAVDIWSMGMVLSELIYCTKQYTQQQNFNQKDRFLFDGNYCYPISPRADEKESIGSNDQLMKIISKYRNLNQDDLSFISNVESKEYIELLHSKAKFNKPLKDMFQKTSLDLIDLMEQMLRINPYLRPTAKQLLRHKVFDKIRSPENEIQSPHKIIINIDKNQFARNYQNSIDKMSERAQILEFQRLIVQESIKLSKQKSTSPLSF